MRNFKYQLITIFFILSGCSTAPLKVDIASQPKADEMNSSAFEERVGQSGYYFMMLNFKFDDDPKLQNKLNRICARVSHYTERPNIRYKIFILDTKYRNAFSFPDGYIFITNSMVSTLDSDDKIAAIFAHEIAHITHKHLLNTYERKKGNSILKVILGKDVFDMAAELGYSRSNEFQADQTALRYLYRSGYNPELMVTALEDIKRIEKEDDIEAEKDKENKNNKDKWLNAFLTHPYTENRIVNIKNYMQEVYVSEKVQYKAEDFNF